MIYNSRNYIDLIALLVAKLGVFVLITKYLHNLFHMYFIGTYILCFSQTIHNE